MATITTDTYLDGGTARTAGETWTINGCTLTIRTDTRVHANAPASMTGTLGAITTSTAQGGGLFIDASAIRWMKYDTGSGNVPAIGTSVTQGAVSGYLLGVWADIDAAPTAAGSAMPATGYLKFRSVTGGQFATGALTGIGANALATPGSGSGADAPGWLEFVQDSGTTNTMARLGLGFKTRGNWFYLGTTTGSAGQQLKTPTNGGGSLTACQGVQIETSPGSGVFEWYPTLTTASYWKTANLTTDARAKYVEAMAGGVIRIGSDGTNNIGYVPPSGCLVRIPNILQRGAAAASRATNAAPAIFGSGQFSAANGMRYDLEYFEFQSATNAIGSKAPYFRCVNCVFPQYGNFSMTSPQSAPTFTGNLVGTYITSTASNTTQFTYPVFGGTMTDNVFVAGNPGAQVVLVQYGIGMTWTNNKVTCPVQKTSTGIYSIYFQQCSNFTVNGMKLDTYGGFLNLCDGFTITNTDYLDNLVGNTTTTAAQQVWNVTSTRRSTIDGFTFGRGGTIANTSCRNPLVAVNAGCDTVKIRNAGTPSSRLAVAANAPVQAVTLGGVCSNIKIQNMNLASVFSYLVSNPTNCTSGLLIENCTAGTWTNPGFNFWGVTSPSAVRGSVFWGPYTYLNSAPDFVFMDHYTSDTQGALAFFFNPPGANTSAYVTNSFSASGSGYPGDGTLSMDVVGEYTIIEVPYTIKGHTGFQNVAATLTGTSTGNFTYQYQIDTGSGWNGTWKTVNGANLSAETVSAAGFKFKLKVTVATANTGNAIGIVSIPTTTTVSAQAANLYPLDTATLTLTGLVAGSEVRCYTGSDPATAVEIGGVESSGTSFSFSHSSGGSVGFIRIFALGYQPYNYDPYTYSSSDTTLLVQQVVDRNYVNP